jgi:VanZ family protein
LHALTYAGLTLLLFTGSQGSTASRAAKSVLTIALMGALDEFVQAFLPYRTAALSDWLVDCSAGVLVAALLWRLKIECNGFDTLRTRQEVFPPHEDSD